MKRAYPQWDEWRREITRKAEVGQLLDNGFGRMVRANPDRISTTAVAMVGQSCARGLLVECMTFDWAPRQGLTTVRILPTVSQGAPIWGAAYGH